MSARALGPGERLGGNKVSLRPIALEDCTPAYAAWLADPDVNRYLETRWRPQTLESIRAFVAAMLEDPDNYLFAIEEAAGGAHVGNLKVGPVNHNHGYADVSFFLGEKRCWGKGYAAEAIGLAAGFAFGRLGLHRLQAGLYAGNAGSARALEKAGFRREGALRGKLLNAEGRREDHLWYGLLRAEWEAAQGPGRAAP